jgi:hypothetical protein
MTPTEKLTRDLAKLNVTHKKLEARNLSFQKKIGNLLSDLDKEYAKSRALQYTLDERNETLNGLVKFMAEETEVKC